MVAARVRVKEEGKRVLFSLQRRRVAKHLLAEAEGGVAGAAVGAEVGDGVCAGELADLEVREAGLVPGHEEACQREVTRLKE